MEMMTPPMRLDLRLSASELKPNKVYRMLNNTLSLWVDKVVPPSEGNISTEVVGKLGHNDEFVVLVAEQTSPKLNMQVIGITRHFCGWVYPISDLKQFDEIKEDNV